MKKILFVLILLINTNLILSQDLEVKWSEQMEYSNNIDGFFSDYIDVNNKYIYSQYTISKDDGTIKARKIIAFDKKTMAKISSVALYGFKENKINEAEYKDLLFKKIIVQNDFVYVFWTKINSQNEELFIDCYDVSLKRIKPLTKIYSLNFPSNMKRGYMAKTASSIIVLDNQNKEHKIIIGAEIPMKNQYIEFYYGLLEQNLSISNEKKVLLPNKLNDSYFGALSEFEYLRNGNLAIKTNLTSDTEIAKKHEIETVGLRGGLFYYPTFSYLKVSTSEISTIELPIQQSASSNFNLQPINQISKFKLIPVIQNNLVKFYCFYNNTSNDKKLESGIFFTEFDNETMENKGLNFKKFNTETICQLYEVSADEVAKNKYGSDNLKLELALSTEENEIILFASTTVDYSSSSGGIYHKKGGITVFKINDQCEIIWIKSIKRLKTYLAYLNDDLKVIKYNNEIVMTYGSNEDATLNKLSRWICQTELEYILFDSKTGDFQKKLLPLNNTQGTEQVDTYVPSIGIFDNKFYINYTDIKEGVGNVGIISFE